MAERIENYRVRPPKIGATAEDELNQLLQTLHERGILRFANDLAGSQAEVMKVLVGGLSKPGTLNAIQNLSILGMALSRIPPEQFYKVAFALRDGFASVAGYQPEAHGKEAPGVSGAYRLLHDDDLWRAIAPLLAGLKTFAEGLEREVDKPISAFSGKSSDF
ncbi:DUF1641 domain-containing protein [Pseudomonas oligotrophica]|uniref:DUF1641 domain-containing protein n=1 Tax=Pseudomonas oligotrophica TaxID=2912055 RepID=UPI001F1B8E5B|nr:DUF1641 domain-containing protein [Pseudomonas oligotrophica]MCF7203165.1 DUF1641 domain-containing protein [Pseudomonas oligotrophica]